MKFFRLASACLTASSGAFFGAMLPSSGASAQQSADLVSPTELRVCADPSNLPFSNDKREGFENKIAELVGHALNLPVAYTWFPDSQGFVRATLMKNRCDVVMGTAAGAQDVATTEAYYHTGYMLVSRIRQGIDTNSLGDPRMRKERIGLIAGTPPTNLIIDNNLMQHVAVYPLVVDTRIEQPAHTMLTQVANGLIDVGLSWGPIAGYYIKHDHLPLRAVFLDPQKSKVRLDYHIAMGVRPTDTVFRRKLNDVIAKNHDEITRILQDYGVPLMDEQGQALAPSTEKPG